MHPVKEKVSNVASSAQEHAKIYKAKVEEKAEKATARTKEEKEIAEERRKAKEAEAKMELHQDKAEQLHGKHTHMMSGNHDTTYGHHTGT
ncbi:hypothetical protein IFM89_010387 [Coptis chinensis]|uniref:Uncharacterized protein n=1 Tax=Coptis chinensis TaxID=261450 RepID=A0A835IUJ3_9MAGN|nr:hypothetical protein IFM89_010387 [Coptis chinensis]